MQKLIERPVRKARYISVKQDGMEIYTEAISSEGDIRDYLKFVRQRLKLVRQALPQGKWGINIEEQWKERKGGTHFRILNVETEELKEEIL